MDWRNYASDNHIYSGVLSTLSCSKGNLDSKRGRYDVSQGIPHADNIAS